MHSTNPGVSSESSQNPAGRRLNHVRRYTPALSCVVALVVAVIAIHPFMEMGFDDDWTYIRTAKVFAETGHITYNGWAGMMLGWQVVLGALFIKLFGFSFEVTRAPIFAIALLTAFLMQRVFVRLGLNEWNASVGTLTLVMSPIFLPMAYSFMTDIPGLFCILVCLYGCCRAVQAAETNAAVGWLCAAGLSNIALGTVRQIVWLGVLVMVPATGWLLRKRRGCLPVALLLWLGGAAFVVVCMRWFDTQPYTIPEKLIVWPISRLLLGQMWRSWLRAGLTTALFALPVMVAYPWALLRLAKRRQVWIALGLTVSGTLLAGLLCRKAGSIHDMTMPWMSNMLTTEGIFSGFLAGNHPVALSMRTREAISLLTLFVGAACCVGLLMGRAFFPRREQKEQGTLSSYEIGLLLIPFLLAYCGLLMQRTAFIAIFDRYLLTPVFILMFYLLRFYQQRIAQRAPLVCIGFLLLFAGYTIAATHDLFALDRTRLQVANTLQKDGVPRDHISAGTEYNAWTQLEAWGYMNVPELVNPPGAYHRPAKIVPFDSPCGPTPFTPAVTAQYVLAYDETCFQPSQFGPFSYNTWLPPHTRQIFVREAAQ